MRIAFLLFLISFPGFSQSTLEDIIPEIQFKGDTIESLFKYVATSVSYDTRFKDAPPQYHSYDEVLEDVLEDKKGVCMHYATLFDALCKYYGYRSYMIGGYTKFMNQEPGTVPHAWNAVEIDGEWYLFDPTWAAGYVVNDKFIKQYEPELWYKKDPQGFIYSHIPFDPVFQFLENPISHHTVADGTYKPGQTINLSALLQEYETSTETVRLERSLERIDEAGITNHLIANKKEFIQEQLSIHSHNEYIYAFSDGSNLLTDAQKEYERYLLAKKKLFKKSSEAELHMLLQSSSQKLKTAYNQFVSLKITNRQLQKSVKEKIAISDQLLAVIEQEEIFFNKYQKTWKPLRIFVFL
ncbi:MAG: transglutaminase domain-containing protein [Candidatus Cyclobacteriaceae bacterium M2_1C_046]